MNILIVCSGNSKSGISPIVKSQAESLIKIGHNIDYFTIKGKGVLGYLKNIPRLRRFFKKKKYDIVHAHYSLSAIVASFANTQPLVVSLMGSDVESSGIWRFVIKLFNFLFWKAVIVKSQSMKDKLKLDSFVIPNGVDFEKFYPMNQKEAKEKVGFNEKKHILFLANPKRKEKNFILAKKAFEQIKSNNIEMNVIYNISHDMVPFYINASDVVLLTSLWEGSPNIIKEAMACNRPIVATDVGDIKENISDTSGCFVTSFYYKDVAEKLKLALKYNRETNGRKNISFLDDRIIAKKLVRIYNDVIKKRK